MGMVKDIKVKNAADAAAKAAAARRAVFVYRQNIPATASGFSGEVSDMGEVIEAVERQGWQLDQMSFDGRQSSNGGCILLFRRAVKAQPAPVQPPQQPRQLPPPPYGQPQTPPQWQQGRY